MQSQSLDRARLHAAYADGLDPAAVVAEVYARIKAAGDPGIFLSLLPQDRAMALARALPPFDPTTHPLWGLPFAIKDNIDLAGLPTTAACPEFAYDPAQDAVVVARLIAAGAIPIGKTNLDQFATGLVGVRTPYPVPRNAIDPAIVPGGSSSGSAVAVARGLVTFALGTDTAGSGRVPAGLNNIVGLKPSLGALSSRGMVPACRTLDTISIFALTVDDAFAVFAAAAAPDPADPYSRNRVPGPMLPAPARPRIGVPAPGSGRFFGDEGQAVAFEATVARLAGQGAQIVPLDFAPFHAVAEMLYQGAWVAERLAAIGPFLAAHPGALHPTTHAIIAGASALTAVDAFRGLYALAEGVRVLAPVIDSVDLLAVPTVTRFYTLAEVAADPLGPNRNLGAYTNFVNLLDLCGIAVPVEPRADGRPGSLTLLARAGRDAFAASVARGLQADGPMGATGHPVPPRGPLRDQVGPGETGLMVLGAHMTGMALEHELRRLGARPVAAVRTAPLYRLHALPGHPARPGLCRTTGTGAAIAGEVWAISQAQIGAFLAGLPSPLTLGQVTLEDGASVTGCLAEAAALADAVDISAHGGWRAWLAAREAAPAGV